MQLQAIARLALEAVEGVARRGPEGLSDAARKLLTVLVAVYRDTPPVSWSGAEWPHGLRVMFTALKELRDHIGRLEAMCFDDETTAARCAAVGHLVLALWREVELHV